MTTFMSFAPFHSQIHTTIQCCVMYVVEEELLNNSVTTLYIFHLGQIVRVGMMKDVVLVSA